MGTNDMTLGDVIKQARKNAGHTLDSLIAAIPEERRVSKQWLSTIEKEGSRASPEFLVRLHDILMGPSPSSSHSLADWMLRWVEEKLPRESVDRRRLREEAERLIIPAFGGATGKKQIVSLEDFPHAFMPLAVICGDRRESTPKTRGDLFAYSVSITDLTFLQALLGHVGAEVQIRSDKLCVLMTEENLRRTFGQSHLLVLGSPAVNFAARIVNKTAVFRFNLGPEVKEWEEQVRSLTKLDDPDYLAVFHRMAQTPQNIDQNPQAYETHLTSEDVKEVADMVKECLGDQDLRTRMNAFRKAGFIDPADATLHGETTRRDNDFAVISLARNPFSSPGSEFYAILVAGVHGPGTAHAMKVLAGRDRESNFRNHPFGGVIEVKLNQFQEWSDVFEKARWSWQTREYDAEKILKNLAEALKPFRRSTSGPLSSLDKAELEDCISLVKSLARVPAQHSGRQVDANPKRKGEED